MRRKLYGYFETCSVLRDQDCVSPAAGRRGAAVWLVTDWRWCITNMTNGKYIHEIQHKTNLIRITEHTRSGNPSQNVLLYYST